MKKHICKSGIAIIIFLLPFIVSAQWSMVRFDEVNYFTKIKTMTPDAAISFGMLPTSNSFIIRTNNGGGTWDSLTLNVSGNEYMIASAFFTDVQNGYAGGASNGLQAMVRTADNGTSWTDVTPDPSIALQIRGISFINPTEGFAADQWNLYKTVNGGSGWTTYSQGIEIRDIGFADMNVGYICGADVVNAVVNKTNDGGQTWTNVLTTSIPFFPTSGSMQKIDVISPDVVFVSGQYSNLIFKTNNGGISWDTINLSMAISIMDFDFISSLKGHFVSDMGEIYSTSDGGLTWTLEYAVSGGAYGPTVLLTSLSFAGTTGYVCGSNGLIKKYEIATGLFEYEISDNLNMYPNPVSNGHIVNLNVSKDDQIMEVYTIRGTLLSKSEAKNQFDISEFSNGVYVIKIVNNNSVRSGKLIIVK